MSYMIYIILHTYMLFRIQQHQPTVGVLTVPPRCVQPSSSHYQAAAALHNNIRILFNSDTNDWQKESR